MPNDTKEPTIWVVKSIDIVYTNKYILVSEGGIMKKAKIFKNGQSQAVRLPKEMRFSGDEVLVQKHGNGVLILPLDKSFDALKQSLDSFSSDFMSERKQPAIQTREDLE